MCGIAGMVGLADRERIERMTQSIAHRGPDSSGIKLLPEGPAALGHRRLSILDLSERGHQPMADDGERFWITFNGEIYNFQDIRRELEGKGYGFKSGTDTEVIIYAYKEWGTDCLAKFNGMFAFAIWDSLEQTLFAARDRIGIKPFYYHHSSHRFVFASEIKSMLESGLVPREIDYLALHTPEDYQVAPSTGFKHIQKLLPGHYLLFRGEQLQIERYWSIEPRENNPSIAQATDELDALLQSAVRMQMIADVPVGAFLSGGLDSSLIVALMRKHAGQPVATFTIRYTDNDQKFERVSDDSRYAKQVATLFGCRHSEFVIEPKVTELLPKMMWHLDEPLCDAATINTYLISQSARQAGIVVLLSGMGGDEIFGGYRTQLACLLADKYRAYVPEFARTLLAKGLSVIPSATSNRGIKSVRWAKRFASLAAHGDDNRFALKGVFPPDAYEEVFSWERTDPITLWQHPYSKAYARRVSGNGVSYLTRMCLADTEIFLPDHNLTYSDKCTMAAGVEGRPPLTDHRLVEFMFSLHPRFRIKGLTQKYLLKKVGERHLPREIVYRPKAPFGAPLRAWIRGGLKEMVNDFLSEETLNRRGIYNAKYVSRVIENDRSGKEDNAHFIWHLLCNELWLRTFFP